MAKKALCYSKEVNDEEISNEFNSIYFMHKQIMEELINILRWKEKNINNKVQNPKTEVPANSNMNDRDFLNDILESEKNMSVNYTYALNEASNEELFKRIYDMFIHIKETQRNLFELSFKKGWYTLEKAEENKINEEINTLSNMFNEIK